MAAVDFRHTDVVVQPLQHLARVADAGVKGVETGEFVGGYKTILSYAYPVAVRACSASCQMSPFSNKQGSIRSPACQHKVVRRGLHRYRTTHPLGKVGGQARSLHGEEAGVGDEN